MSIFALFLFLYYWLFNGDVINILTTSLFSILYSLLVFVFSIYYALANEEKIAIKYFLSVFYKTNGTQNIKSDKMLNKLYKNQSIDAYLKTFSHSSFENSYFSFISSFFDFCDDNKITKPDIKFFYDISLKFCKRYKNDYMLFGVCAYVVFITLKLIRESENNDFKNYILNCYYNFENKLCEIDYVKTLFKLHNCKIQIKTIQQKSKVSNSFMRLNLYLSLFDMFAIGSSLLLEKNSDGTFSTILNKTYELSQDKIYKLKSILKGFDNIS